MKIILNNLSIINFKGIKELYIDFNDDQTYIYGQNASGKTTVFDAFTWLFFGKDSSDRKDFNIKPLDAKNNPSHKLEHEVNAVIFADGQRVTLRRVFKEKWTKKRGEETAEFTGHETLFYYNEVPLQQQEYKKKIDELINEDLFKLITNTLYFNSIKWQDRREVLLNLAGHITDEQIAGDNQQFKALLAALSGKSLAEYKKQISARKKKLKDDLEAIPTRIDEINRNLPEAVNFIAIEKQIADKTSALADIDTMISDRNKGYQAQLDAIREKQNVIHSKKSELQQIEFRIRREYAQKQNDAKSEGDKIWQAIENCKADIKSKSALLESTGKRKEGLNLRLDVLRGQFDVLNAKEIVFDQHEFNCPACKRALDPSDIEAKKAELIKNFNEEKVSSLDLMNEKGQQLVKEVEECDTLINTLNDAIAKLDQQRIELDNQLAKFNSEKSQDQPSVESVIKNDVYYQVLTKDIAALEAEITDIPEVNIDDLKAKKAEINAALDQLKKELTNKEVIERGKKRIAELEAEERSLSQQIANLERTEFTIDEFSRTRIDIMESRINDKFRYVSFKLFDTQINGGEVECCETLVNSNGSFVPFTDANNAGRINAGIDIINALCKHHDIYAPIFVDNRESVTNLIVTESQLINLVVSEHDANLRVA